MRDRRDDERSFRGPMGTGSGREEDRFRDRDRDREWERERSWRRDEDMGGSGWSGASGRGGFETREEYRAEHGGEQHGYDRDREREGGYGGGWGGQREHSGMNAYGRQEEDRQWGRDSDRYDRDARGGYGGVGYERGYDPSGRARSFDRGVVGGVRGQGLGRGMGGSDLGFSYGGHAGGGDIEDRGPHYGKGPKGYKRSDERIREDVCDCIARQGHIDASDVEVKVESGTVVLGGTVAQRHHKRVLEHMVERLLGVEDVRNELRLKRDEQTQMRGQATQPSTQQNGDQNRQSQPNGKNARA